MRVYVTQALYVVADRKQVQDMVLNNVENYIGNQLPECNLYENPVWTCQKIATIQFSG